MSNLVSFVVLWSSDQIMALVGKFRIFCCNVFPFPLFQFTMEPKILLVGFKKMPDIRIYNIVYRCLLSKVDFKLFMFLENLF